MMLYLNDKYNACLYRLCEVCSKEEASEIVHHDMSFILVDENDNDYEGLKLVTEWEV